MPFQPPAGDQVIGSVGAAETGFTPPPTDTVVRGPALMPGIIRSVAQGATFGFGDEAEAAARALLDRDDGEDFADAYRRHRDQVRGGLEQFEGAFPKTALASELAGGFAVPGLGAARTTATAARAGAGLGAQALRGAGLGAGMGGLYGAGKAAEIEDVPGAAAGGALAGAAVGGALPPALAGARAVGRGIAGAVSPERMATRRISQAMARDRTTPGAITQRLEEARKLGRPANVADVGGASLRRELETVAQSPGPAGQMVERALQARNKTQLSRLSRDLVRATGVEAKNVEQAIQTTMQRRAEIAEPLYRKALEFPAELSDDLVKTWKRATETPIGRQALGRARRILNVKEFDKAPLMERINAWKQGVDDVIGAARRKGTFNEARRAQEMKDDVVGLVDAINPAYRVAREAWEHPSKYLDAIDQGRGILSGKVTAAQVRQAVAKMTDAEKEAYRIGAVDALVTKMRQDAAREPNLLKYLRAPERMDKLAALMSPEKAQRFRKTLEIEEQMFETASQALRNSATARRLAAMDEQEKQLRVVSVVNDLLDLVYSPLRNLIVRKIPAVGAGVRERLLAKQNEEIARRLLGRGGAQLPAPAAPGGGSGASLVPPGIIGSEAAMPGEGRQ